MSVRQKNPNNKQQLDESVFLGYSSHKINAMQHIHTYKAVKKNIKLVIQILFPIKLLYTQSNSTDCCIITFDLFQYN